MGKEWFSNWFNSEYYHLLYQNRDDVEATNFINKLVAFLHPKSDSKVLDIACGKGRHSKALFNLGLDVTGIDISPESIVAAKKFETEKLHFFEHDMRKNFYVNYFQIAFNFFTSFGYFDTYKEHQNTIKSFANCLTKNGVLVLDYLNVHLAEKTSDSSFEKIIDNKEFIIDKWQTNSHFYKRISIKKTNGEVDELSTEKVAKFYLNDFEQLLNQNRLFVDKVFGDYELSNYDENVSPRLILIARKK